MNNIYITNLTIEKVRHLENITIPLSNESRKHLILTGQNGSGKTSVLEAAAHYLNELVTSDRMKRATEKLIFYENKLKEFQDKNVRDKETFEAYKYLVHKSVLTDDDFEEIANLEMFLNKIPDYLALGITTGYQRLKMEFEKREDI